MCARQICLSVTKSALQNPLPPLKSIIICTLEHWTHMEGTLLQRDGCGHAKQSIGEHPDGANGMGHRSTEENWR